MPPSHPSKLSHPLVAYKPISLLYQLFKITTILARLPLWLIRSLVPALRPYRTWNFTQAFVRHMTINVLDISTTIGITASLPLTPGKEGARWTTIEPFTDELYVGPLVSSTVRPAKIGGTWYGTDAAPSTAEQAASWKKVSLHIHGGAFVIGDGRIENTGYLCGNLIKHAKIEAVFAPQYRLAGYDGRDPFPAALQDALTSYLYLIRTLGIKPENITLSGDSAGGNLALGLLRYLERFGGQINVPKPGRVVLISPWVNPSASIRTDYSKWELFKTDILPQSFIRWGAKTYIKQAENVSEGSEWVDPLGHPFKTDTPVFLSYASREILSVDCARWATEWEGAGNTALTQHIEVDAPHDCLLVGNMTGWDEAARETGQHIAKWLDNN
ncbi:hypothetical protein N0V93_002436 [Gnomoniopsis smithogilvyi]|uniref:Alpha/beta hydrolase fold-3 domain-containing protein n=1 Tax=Gnomoniopsis smithogilvyi TaxID=1191159 RepID=A0A9W8YXK7_9PEZI|nr:hypothetical protein N0V93_002436 [Gnomoniopsis smithogilvyi]